MASEPLTSSWNPALMPNSIHDFKAAHDDHIIQPAPAEPLPETPEYDLAHEQEQNGLDHHEPEPESEHEDQSYSHGGDVEGGSGLAEEQPAPYQQVAETSAEPPAPADDEEREEGGDDAAAPTTRNVQHSSSMSFARTISHEVSFSDDDNTEWSLSRTDTDPFKFLPPSERTNSFPVVPLMAEEPERIDDVPLPSNQALDVLEETERDVNMDEEEYQADGQHQPDSDDVAEPPKDSQRRHAPSRSIGGDLQWSEDVESEARYEEGIPLIPHSNVESDAAASGENAHLPSFDDDNEDDDFFNQINQSAEDAPAGGEEAPSLQRKSTMQVLASANPGPPSRQSTLDETPEWLEEDHVAPDANLTEKEPPSNQDLASKWEEAFASDDDGGDFLIEEAPAEEKEVVDAAAFLGSDDEGLLDDLDDEAQPPTQTAPLSSQASSVASTSAYAPSAYVPTPQRSASASAYTPVTTPSQPSFYGAPSPQVAAPQPPPQYGHVAPPPQLTESPKAQSFADKSKGGYSSPYDLPSDLVTTTVKPRKRASMQQLQVDNSSLHPPPPPRSASMSATETVPPGGIQKSPLLRHKSSFFEDLPAAPRPRPISRQSNRAVSPNPQALATSPHGPSPLSPPMASQIPPAAAIPAARVNLVAPERVSPYAPLQSPNAPLPSPAASASRYSPAPPPLGSSQSAPPPAGRYSPAPPVSHPTNAYNPAVSATPPQAVLPHLPRTSSPLAHFEISSDKPHGVNGEVAYSERRASSSYEPRLTRVASLPPTREVEEEEDLSPGARRLSSTRSPPPLPTPSLQATLSPPKRPGSGYIPSSLPSTQPGFVPPPRAQTQSPGATRTGPHIPKPVEAVRRPSSSHSPASPPAAKPAYASHTYPRPPSLTMNMIAPTDGREHDPLQRWQGVPIISWGVGGTVVTSFPKSIPRYVMNQTTPSILRAAGEVKVQNIKEIESLQDRLAKFPGPLKGKSKKKEVLAWLSSGIESLAKELPDVSFHPQLSHEAKRSIERLLLWRILRVFIEYDGVLEGNPAAEKAVRDILSPGTVTPAAVDGAVFPTDPTISINGTAMTSMQADGVDPATMDQIRRDLLVGNSETAVWAAVDKRLWGHAMLISHTVSPDLYKRVAQEFVRKEVNHPGQSNESLAALYKILSGNYDDCVDELVPVHARAGLQLVSTGSSSEPAKDATEGLDKWRETLTLVLSNRSLDDIRGLNALGKLLSSYGRAEAAHICFIFSRQISIYGGFDDPNVDFVLLGSDHRQNAHQIAKDTEALQLSEVYEYGLSLSGAPSATAGAPHLAAYKLHHAIALAEYGYRDRALQYCDAILSAMSSQTKRSPYHHQLLEAAVDDFMRRLKQAPKEESSSWMSKPSMNKVSDSMWNRFNKFVAGDESENANGAPAEESGPFARIGTPSMSRSPSVSNFDTLGIASPGYPGAGAPAATSALSSALSRYAPVNSSQPMYGLEPSQPPSAFAQSGRSSNEYPNTSTYGASSSLAGSPPAHINGFASSSLGYQPMTPVLNENKPHQSGYQPYGYQESPKAAEEPAPAPSTQGYQPISYGYEPPTNSTVPETEDKGKNVDEGASSGYEPPSFQPYGYEPPSYEPDAAPAAEDNDDEPKPKKKSFMDDDDDNFGASQSKEKSKAEKDRENEEMFRKAAEEDAKRAAAAQQAKKGWGFSSWFGGSKKEGGSPGELGSPGKPIKAKLGEASSFVYDPELKRWVNKKPGAEQVEAKAATPPPPRAGPRSVSGTPPLRQFTPPPAQGRSSVPPSSSFGSLAPPAILNRAPSQESMGGGPPPMLRSMSSTSTDSKPTSRPTTSMSNASSIDDLLSASGPRKPGQKKARKAGRYVDVMAK